MYWTKLWDKWLLPCNQEQNFVHLKSSQSHLCTLIIISSSLAAKLKTFHQKFKSFHETVFSINSARLSSFSISFLSDTCLEKKINSNGTDSSFQFKETIARKFLFNSYGSNEFSRKFYD